ncbi:MAG: H-NS histone family protein [Betaproteobacteria bacterium]|nr:H-NS histone family protein [Betaproteobacteria bacterium]
MDLSKLNLTELKRLQKRVETEIERRANVTRKDVLKKVQKMAAEAGISLNDLIGTEPAKKAPKRGRPVGSRNGRNVAVRKTAGIARYKNPENEQQTWTGKGRKPLWAQAWIDAGKPLSELEIK